MSNETLINKIKLVIYSYLINGKTIDFVWNKNNQYSAWKLFEKEFIYSYISDVSVEILDTETFKTRIENHKSLSTDIELNEVIKLYFNTSFSKQAISKDELQKLLCIIYPEQIIMVLNNMFKNEQPYDKNYILEQVSIWYANYGLGDIS